MTPDDRDSWLQNNQFHEKNRVQMESKFISVKNIARVGKKRNKIKPQKRLKKHEELEGFRSKPA